MGTMTLEVDDRPFHDGERRAQALAGGGSAGAGIRTFMPEQHRSFFASLPIVFLGLRTADGWPVATAIAGQPGFIASPDPTVLRLEADLPNTDPGASSVHDEAEIGLLGLEFSTRRRNRANGVIADLHPGGFSVAIRQSFGNCAQYIQTRQVEASGPQTVAVPSLFV